MLFQKSNRPKKEKTSLKQKLFYYFMVRPQLKAMKLLPIGQQKLSENEWLALQGVLKDTGMLDKLRQVQQIERPKE